MSMRLVFVFLLSVLALAGCYSSQPVVRVDSEISFAKYETLEIVPVADETEKEYPFDVAAKLTDSIKERLRERGYTLTDPGASSTNVLVVKSILVAYEPGNAFKRWLGAPLVPAGKTQATVQTSLIDKETGKTVGDILSAEAVTGGGLFSVGADKSILDVIAKEIADEMDKRFPK